MFFGGLGVSHSQKKLKTTTGPVYIFHEEYNSIGLVVTEILRDRQTDGYKLLCIIDYDTLIILNLGIICIAHLCIVVCMYVCVLTYIMTNT